MNIRKIFTAAILLCLPLTVSAGLVEDGPYIVWFNLSENPQPVDDKVSTYLRSGKSLCWRAGSLLYMVSKPNEITDDLVNRALVGRNPTAIKQLNVLLKRPFGEAEGGFDGIVAYSDKPKAAMYGLATGSRKVDKSIINLRVHPEDVEVSFCDVKPGVSRGP